MNEIIYQNGMLLLGMGCVLGILLGLLAALLHWPIEERDHSAQLQTAPG